MSAAETFYIPRKIWTREEVDRLCWDGLHLELIDGELIDKMGKNPPHIFWKGVLGDWLREEFGSEYVRSEDPIDVAPADNPKNEPEPDLVLSSKSTHELRSSTVKPEDVRLLVEISDSTYDFDRNVKAGLYARAGIPEYWIVDVRKESAPRLVRHLNPQNGQYQDVQIFNYDETVHFMESSIRLADLG